MKLCRDCKHLSQGNSVCIRPCPIIGVDYVYGRTESALCRYAFEERNFPSTINNQGFCGPEAKYFEEKVK